MEGGSRAGRIACLMGVTGLADSAHVSDMSLSSCLGASSERSGLHRSDVGVSVGTMNTDLVRASPDLGHAMERICTLVATSYGLEQVVCACRGR